MAKNVLKTDFKDDILSANMGGKRKYRMIQNNDGTISFEDVTEYTQIGSDFGSKQVNETNLAVNNSVDKEDVIDNLDDIAANVTQGKVAGALALRELNSKLSNKVDAPRLSVNAETLTGEYFAGKPVYAKIIDVGTMPNNTAKTINTGIEGARYFWIDPGNSMIRNSAVSYPIPYVDPAQATYGVMIRLANAGKTLIVETKTSWSGYSAFVTVKYTKA